MQSAGDTDGEQLQALHNALLEAFPTEDALRELLLALGWTLSIVHRRALTAMVLDVIEHARAHGRLHDLGRAACKLRPHHGELHRIVHELWPTIELVPPPGDAHEPVPASALTENDWKHLLGFLRERRLTPIIGPGVSRGLLPADIELAGEWAERWQYPFPDRGDLTRVSQFLALTEYQLLPHEQLQQRYAAAPPHDPGTPEELHAFLAELNLPLYLTTNYDDLMMRALAHRHLTLGIGTKPVRAFPCWNQNLRDQEVTPVDVSCGPLVYHLFGHHELPESMVLTEDDHFDFLSAFTDPRLVPSMVKRAIGSTSLLFIGFGVLDFSFRVLIRALLRSITAPNKRLGVAVQLPPENLTGAQRAQVEKYLQSFLNAFGNQRFRVFWGNTAEFTRELRDRWREQRDHVAAAG